MTGAVVDCGGVVIGGAVTGCIVVECGVYSGRVWWGVRP
jgi:hypothetical protein